MAADALRRKFAGHDGMLKAWLFPALVDVIKRSLDPASGIVTFAHDTPIGSLLLAEPKAQASEAVFHAVAARDGQRNEILLPILRPFDGQGSTDDVAFLTRKAVIPAEKSHVNLVVLDGVKGNTWEETVAGLLEDDERVAAFVKNDHLGFTIPYVWEGKSHQYLPDFLARLIDTADGASRTLIIEVSGGRKSPGPTAVKAATARDQWCRAVNNQGTFGRWGYVEIVTMLDAGLVLGRAIETLRTDPVDAPTQEGIR